MNITFARHGESHANLLHVFDNVPPGHGLTETGRQQASNLALRLANNRPDAIFASPLARALETAEIVGGALATPVIVDADLIEFHVGDFEGTTARANWEEFSTIRNQWANGMTGVRVSNGESYEDIVGRVQRFIDRMAVSDHKEVLALSHGGTLLCALPALFEGLPRRETMLRSFGHTEMVRTHVEGAKRVCLGWA